MSSVICNIFEKISGQPFMGLRPTRKSGKKKWGGASSPPRYSPRLESLGHH